MLKSRSLPILAGAAAVGLSLFPVAPANADPITGVFTSDHCTGGCLTGQANGGSVTVTQVAPNELGFSISLANGNDFVSTGFDASFGFQLTGISSVVFSNTTPSGTTEPGFFIPGTSSGNGTETAGSLMMDGLGTFNYGLKGAGNGGGPPTDGNTLTFDITATGLTLADITTNGNGQFFGADILSGTTGKTGGIDVSAVPAPLIGHGFLVLLAVGGVLFGGKLMENLKKRQSLAA